MKNILFTFALLLFTGIAFSQLKVVTNGNTEARQKLIVGSDVGSGTAAIDVGKGRTAAGTSAFSFFNGPGAFKMSMFVTPTDICRFNYNGSQLMSIGNATNTPLYLRTRNLDRVIINGNGRVDILGSATVNGGVAVTSDRRLKKNIRDYDGGLNEVLSMRPVTFQYNGKAWTQEGEEFIGLVAQELQQIAPELVSDHTVTLTDETGEVKTDHTYLKIHDSQLKYVLVNAIKEQQELIESQSEMIDQLALELLSIKEILNERDVNNDSIELENGSSAKLMQNKPNPFDGLTKIDYFIPESATRASIEIYNVQGKVIESLNIEGTGAGTLDVRNKNLSSGQYFYRLIVDGTRVDTKKMTITK